MPSFFPLKPTHAPVKAYFAALATFQRHGHTTGGNTRSAFADLIKRCCSPYGWHLVEEYQFKGTGKQPLRADGALVDDLTLVHGLWEAKDTADDLQAEIKKKVARGYPLTNILFQPPTRAVLYQDNRIALDTPITEPEKLLGLSPSSLSTARLKQSPVRRHALKRHKQRPCCTARLGTSGHVFRYNRDRV